MERSTELVAIPGDVAPEPQVEPEPQSKPETRRTDSPFLKAQEWIQAYPPAISGQRGSPHTFGAACCLIKGFGLTRDEAMTLLLTWNIRCVPPWTEEDLLHKIIDAETSHDFQSRGYMLRAAKSTDFGDFTDSTIQNNQSNKDHLITSNIINDPADIANKFKKSNMINNELCSYAYIDDVFYQWEGSKYMAIKAKIMNSNLSWFIEDLFMKRYNEDCAMVDLDQVHKVKKHQISNRLIDNVKTALINLISVDSQGVSEPFWIGIHPDGWDVENVISAKNRLLHLPSFVQGKRKTFVKKIPSYFSTCQLDYPINFDRYNGPVDPPPIWRHFFDSVWEDDAESIICLQEWMGYLLTPCTKLQKMLMLIGPKRSGKSTIIKVMKRIIGRINTCSPTFKSLTSPFGKEDLIGKMAAFFPDARLTHRTDAGEIVEALLSISGEDEQTISRKYKESITKKLSCRFIISANEVPRLPDSSGALVSRAIILRTTKSFLDQEDIDLENKLIPEMPAILRWAIDGWKSLHERGRFIQPESGVRTIEEYTGLSSPITRFCEDCLEFGDEVESNIQSIYSCWSNWCDGTNREHRGDLDSFKRNLGSAHPEVSITGQRPDDGLPWDRIVRGVRIRQMIDPAITLAHNEIMKYGINGNGTGFHD